jgi:hypothetical protein
MAKEKKKPKPPPKPPDTSFNFGALANKPGRRRKPAGGGS